MRNPHRRGLEENQAQVGQGTGMQFSLEGRTAFRRGVMNDQVLARDIVPLVKSVARMNLRRREKPLHRL